MVFTHHGINSLSRNGGSGEETVIIGGREYRTVIMPDGNTWLAENLDYKFDGCTFAPSERPESPAAWYYSGISDDRYSGLLYNWYAVKYLNDHKNTLLPQGWHVPTSSEYDKLFKSIDSNYVNSNVGTNNTDAGGKLKCLDYYDSSYFPTGWNGTDDYGFSVSPCGFYREDRFVGRNDAAYIWTADSIFTDNAKFLYFPKEYNNILTKSMHQKCACSLRLVNATATEE